MTLLPKPLPAGIMTNSDESDTMTVWDEAVSPITTVGDRSAVPKFAPNKVRVEPPVVPSDPGSREDTDGGW